MNTHQNTDTMPVLKMIDGQAMADSRDIAAHFEKRHSHVLEAIRNLEIPESFNEPNFRPVGYHDAKGELRPRYDITRDGFTLLVMGFTGEKAMEWKERYIEAFNAMAEELQHGGLALDDPDFTSALSAVREARLLHASWRRRSCGPIWACRTARHPSRRRSIAAS